MTNSEIIDRLRSTTGHVKTLAAIVLAEGSARHAEVIKQILDEVEVEIPTKDTIAMSTSVMSHTGSPPNSRSPDQDDDEDD